jgi:hypothetical protein
MWIETPRTIATPPGARTSTPSISTADATGSLYPAPYPDRSAARVAALLTW